MMTWLDFLALTLAAAAVVDVWFNGSIFADWRAFMQDKADGPEDPGEDAASDTDEEDEGEPLPFMMRIADRVVPTFIAELLSCSFCFSHHTPWLLAVLLFFPSLLVETPWIVFLLKVPVYSLAATRLGTVMNALLPAEARYTRE